MNEHHPMMKSGMKNKTNPYAEHKRRIVRIVHRICIVDRRWIVRGIGVIHGRRRIYGRSLRIVCGWRRRIGWRRRRRRGCGNIHPPDHQLAVNGHDPYGCMTPHVWTERAETGWDGVDKHGGIGSCGKHMCPVWGTQHERARLAINGVDYSLNLDRALGLAYASQGKN